MPKKKSPFAPGFDGLTAYGASVLARHVETYWHVRGHGDVQAFRYELPGSPGNYGVRSNLVAGRPPSVARRDFQTHAVVAG